MIGDHLNLYSVDLVSVTDDYTDYKLVIAPLLYMCKGGFDEKIRQFVKNGGSFLTTYFSGYVEESDVLPETESNSFVYKGKNYFYGKTVMKIVSCINLHKSLLLQGAVHGFRFRQYRLR